MKRFLLLMLSAYLLSGQVVVKSDYKIPNDPEFDKPVKIESFPYHEKNEDTNHSRISIYFGPAFVAVILGSSLLAASKGSKVDLIYKKRAQIKEIEVLDKGPYDYISSINLEITLNNNEKYKLHFINSKIRVYNLKKYKESGNNIKVTNLYIPKSDYQKILDIKEDMTISGAEVLLSILN